MQNGRESAGGIVLNGEGKIALVCQHGNSWSFPKGRVEDGESSMNAARREIQEETGLDELECLRELGSYERYSIGKDGIGENREWGLRKRIFFLFRTNGSTLAPRGGEEEVTEARWVSVPEALELLTHPKDKEFLESIRGTIEAL